MTSKVRQGPWQWWQRRRSERRAGLEPGGAEVAVERDLAVPAEDGVELLTDHWYPLAGTSGRTVVVRSPYGRRGADPVARVIAEHGHHVVVQSCRGTFGSGGDFEPFHHERADGRALVAWLREQSWYSGDFVTFGPSYLGFTQWAIAEDRPADLSAMVVVVSARNFHDAVIHPGGGFAIETAVTWLAGLDLQEDSLPQKLFALPTLPRTVARSSDAPVAEAISAALGHDETCYQDWLDHPDGTDPYWTPITFSQDPAGLPPVVLVAGWHDLFLDEQVADFEALRAAGQPARLVVGPWTHADPGSGAAGLRELLDLLAGVAGDRAPVHLLTTGEQRWVDLDEWPSAPEQLDLHLHPTRQLLATPTHTAAELRYRYDPDDPTPNAGGRGLNAFTSGPRRQSGRERRDDVVTFTGEVLTAPMEVIGRPVLRLATTATAASFDLFVRLCEVDAAGVSTSVTEGYRRFSQADLGDDGVSLVLAPMAHRFARGHRVRLQISGGGHPLQLRNPGTGAPLRADQVRQINEQTLLLGAGQAVLQLPLGG